MSQLSYFFADTLCTSARVTWLVQNLFVICYNVLLDGRVLRGWASVEGRGKC